MIKEEIRQQFQQAINGLVVAGKLSPASRELVSSMGLSRTKDKNHGDFASNIALILAKTEGKSPRDIAAIIKPALEAIPHFFTKVDVAGPGFINLSLADETLASVIPHIARLGRNHGRTKAENKLRVLIEFVSANPTGGLHLGHARGAFVGDAIARLLEAAGFLVTKEHYVNDTGNQVHTLARTIHKRYRELFGENVSIEEGEYPGEYVKDIAQALKDLHGNRYLNQPEEVWLEELTKFGVEYNLALIRRSLNNVDIEMDEWFFESTLHEQGKLATLIDAYEKRDMIYDADVAEGTEEKIRREKSKAALYAHMQEGGTFLKTSLFGDEEDRIIKRRDGRFVYLTADLAYHHDKYARNFDMLVNVFGADHAGHVARIKAGMAALGHDPQKLSFVLVQMVRLIKGGQEVRFSKRAGQIVSLDDLIDEVGKDVARFVFLMRSPHSQFDFDIDAVKKQSNDNPVFYVQYGHARMATILSKARNDFHIDFDVTTFGKKEQELLSVPEERELILRISELEEIVRDAALAFEPHRLIFYCQELIKIFHSYFTKYRNTEKIISDDVEKTKARLSLVFAIKLTIFNALSFLGIHAPEYMEQNESHDHG